MRIIKKGFSVVFLHFLNLNNNNLTIFTIKDRKWLKTLFYAPFKSFQHFSCKYTMSFIEITMILSEQ